PRGFRSPGSTTPPTGALTRHPCLCARSQVHLLSTVDSEECLTGVRDSECGQPFTDGHSRPTRHPPCRKLVPTIPVYQGSPLVSNHPPFSQPAWARLLPPLKGVGFRRDDSYDSTFSEIRLFRRRSHHHRGFADDEAGPEPEFPRCLGVGL